MASARYQAKIGQGFSPRQGKGGAEAPFRISEAGHTLRFVFYLRKEDGGLNKECRTENIEGRRKYGIEDKGE